MAGESAGKYTRFVIGATISAPTTAPPEELCVKRHNIGLMSQELKTTCSKSFGRAQFETGVEEANISLTADMHVGTATYATFVAGNVTAFRLRIWEYAPPGTDLSVTSPDWDFSAVKTFEANLTGEVDGLVTFDFKLRPTSTYTTPSLI